MEWNIRLASAVGTDLKGVYEVDWIELVGYSGEKGGMEHSGFKSKKA